MYAQIKNWIKSIYLWLIVPENREIGLQYTKTILDLADVVTKTTKNKKDDQAVKMLTKKFNQVLQYNDNLDSDGITKAAKTVNRIKNGSLKDVSFDFSNGKLSTYIGSIGAQYNTKDGSIRLGLRK
tara:strand:+ start:1192 stop:1569 length:378 start_codon:yes stop_codon:yes gene_type:complete